MNNKLVLYSGFDNSDNSLIDSELLKLLSNSQQQSICYIPSQAIGSEPYFLGFCDYYSRYGLKKISKFIIDNDESELNVSQLFNYDAIFLSGGNTFYFLSQLKRRKLIPVLRDYVHKGGILIGESAGSIIQTPNIRLAGVSKLNGDPNDVGLEDLSALSLTEFEFFPHYEAGGVDDESLLEYSKSCPNIIYSCPNGSGIIFTEGKVRLIGKVYRFLNGVVTLIN